MMAYYTVLTLVTQAQIHTTKFECQWEKKLSKLKSSQYPVWMTQNPKKGDFREWKSKQFPGDVCPRTPPPPLEIV